MGSDRWERDVDPDTGEKGYSRTYDRGNRTEKEFVGDHGTHYIEETYHRSGQTYRTEDDGTVTKRR